MNTERKPEVYAIWQLCPKCNGQGIVGKPSYIPGDINEWTSSEPFYECDLCSGKKIIYIPFPHTVTTKVTDEEILSIFKQYSRMNFEWEWVEKYGAINHEAFIKAVRDLLTKEKGE